MRAVAPIFEYTPPPQAFGADTTCPIADVPKVSTQLAEIPEAKATFKLPEIDIADVIDPDVPHCGRRRCSLTLQWDSCTNVIQCREREIMRENLLKLIACNRKSSKPFWKLVRSWTDNKPTKPRVTLEQLHDSFKSRLNPPDDLPEQFDADLHEIVQKLNDTIPKVTTDCTSGSSSR
jgi:hypothetical protein